MDKNKLQKRLNSIDVPRQLENRIRRNWHQQLQEEGSNKRVKMRLTFATLSLLLSVVILRTTFSTPGLITAALDDIAADARHSIGVSIPLETILNTSQIQAPLQDMPLRMTKYCNLGNTKTVHMQVAGANQGYVHLFVKNGRFDHHFWQDSNGRINNMSWKLIHPRNDLDVLVIYSPDMNPVNVERLVQQMFYS